MPYLKKFISAQIGSAWHGAAFGFIRRTLASRAVVVGKDPVSCGMTQTSQKENWFCTVAQRRTNYKLLKGTARYVTVRHGTVWHGTARYGTVRHGTARYSTARYSTVRHGTAWHGTVQHGTARHGTARYGTARHGTARYSMAHKTAEVSSCYRLLPAIIHKFI